MTYEWCHVCTVYTVHDTDRYGIVALRKSIKRSDATHTTKTRQTLAKFSHTEIRPPAHVARDPVAATLYLRAAAGRPASVVLVGLTRVSRGFRRRPVCEFFFPREFFTGNGVHAHPCVVWRRYVLAGMTLAARWKHENVQCVIRQ